MLQKKNVDSIVLLPGLVSTKMVDEYHNWYNTCMPQETANGTICNLGLARYTHGSMIHTLWAIQVAWTPEFIRNMQRKAEGAAVPEGSYKYWFHI